MASLDSALLLARPRKSLGQNFLVDERIAAREAEAAACDGKAVLEIGAGLGALTIPLAKRAREVIAVEKDRRLLPFLKSALAGYPNARIVCADFLEMNPEPVDVIVSNTPYSISSPILFRLPLWRFERALLCLQREFAERMVAGPGERERSRLSFSSQYYFDVKILFRVPRSAFKPMPEVESAVVELLPRGRVFDAALEKFAGALFQHRRKRLINAVVDSRRQLNLGKAEARALFASMPFSEKRVLELAEEEVVQAARALRKTI
ncbi:MAG: 16S rRNA (adenine(1518)-N(6)/adenine(1519)-N(6))-dimethyltransferase RsmA [Candidatus Micrarchaeia archaeon]